MGERSSRYIAACALLCCGPRGCGRPFPCGRPPPCGIGRAATRGRRRRRRRHRRRGRAAAAVAAALLRLRLPPELPADGQRDRVEREVDARPDVGRRRLVRQGRRVEVRVPAGAPTHTAPPAALSCAGPPPPPSGERQTLRRRQLLSEHRLRRPGASRSQSDETLRASRRSRSVGADGELAHGEPLRARKPGASLTRRAARGRRCRAIDAPGSRRAAPRVADAAALGERRALGH